MNTFQPEPMAEAAMSVDLSSDLERQMTDPWLGLNEVVDLDAITEAAQALINPLGEQVSLTEASLGDLDLHQNGNSLSLAHDDTVLLTSVDGHIEASERVSPETAETLQGWVKEHVWVWQEVPFEAAIPEERFEPQSVPEEAPGAGVDLPVKESLQADVLSDPPQKPQQAPPAPKPSQHFEAIKVVQMQFAAMAEVPTRQFFQRLATDLGEQATKSVDQLRKGLESEEFKALPQTLSNVAQEGLTKTVESMGHGLEKGGQWIASRPDALKEAIESFGHRLEKAGQWLSSRPQAIQEQRIARSALEVFDRGFARTQETAYEYQGFTVESQGQNRFNLSDTRTTQALMQFEVERDSSPNGISRVTIVDRGDISLEQQQAIAAMRRSPELVLGSGEAEQRHAQHSQQIGFLAKSLADALGTDDYQGKHYRVQVGEDLLSITANDRRGEVFRQSGDQVDSKLEQRDFQRFAQITQIINVQQFGSPLPEQESKLVLG
jgi:hypothetical protein